ncbi:MAG: hypothetical protein SOT34_05005, partial [Candidatus Borkfalkiaceae bacterium]|nr:hypothetical protein [Christensenellaceae bacterium]
MDEMNRDDLFGSSGEQEGKAPEAGSPGTTGGPQSLQGGEGAPVQNGGGAGRIGSDYFSSVPYPSVGTPDAPQETPAALQENGAENPSPAGEDGKENYFNYLRQGAPQNPDAGNGQPSYGTTPNPNGNNQNPYGNPYGNNQNPYRNPNGSPNGNNQNPYGNPYGYNQNPYGNPNGNPNGNDQNPYGNPNGNPYGNDQNPYGNANGNPYGNDQNPYGNADGNPYGNHQNPYGNANGTSDGVFHSGNGYGDNPYQGGRYDAGSSGNAPSGSATVLGVVSLVCGILSVL